MMEKKRSFIRMPYNSDTIIHICILFLALFGLLMVASASMGLAVGDNAYLGKTLLKQFIFTLAGYMGMVFAARMFKFRFLLDNLFPLIIGTAFVLLICLAFPAVNGAKAWIHLPLGALDVTIQPSEFAKISIMLVMAAYLGDVKRPIKDIWKLIGMPLGSVLGFIFIVAILQDDFGSSVVMLIIAGVCFLVPQHKALRQLQNIESILIVCGLIGVVFLLSPYGEVIIRHLPLQPYQISRILSAIDPFQDQFGDGYQLINGLVSFATGGLFGLGYGNSVRKYTNFPAANTDFILAIVVEELGYFGFLFVFIPYLLIIGRLFNYAMEMKSERGKVVLVGTAMYILVHFIFNVGGVTGLIPLTGVPLLMISAGGSSTMSLMVALGISQAVIRQYRDGEIQ
ncbi:MAG: FtsW/RodA/SpoVE family cell cycle protein [Erysipelotrichaceae bacterium]|nr:FtsW/RodA/SpoVE family cell cycle protein [Erysipelotrichaceae bacterium]